MQSDNFQQLSIVVASREYNPAMLTPDFLQASGVVPTDWALARPPALSQQETQLVFKSGLEIKARFGSVIFSESVADRSLDELNLAQVSQNYVAALPNLNYQGLGINPLRFVTFGEAAAAHHYMTEKILNRGDWQNFGIAPMQASINLAYKLERCQLRLSIHEARLKQSEGREIPAIMFSGNFNYALVGDSAAARRESLQQVIAHWQTDWGAFNDLIEQQFSADMRTASILAA